MERGLVLTVGGKPAISNLCAIMIPDEADINDVYIDYRYVGPGSIAFTTSNEQIWNGNKWLTLAVMVIMAQQFMRK